MIRGNTRGDEELEHGDHLLCGCCRWRCVWAWKARVRGSEMVRTWAMTHSALLAARRRRG